MPETTLATVASPPPVDPGEFAPSATPAPRPAAQPPAPAQQPARPTPGSKAWAEMTPEQRHAQLRGPENPRARGHSPAIEQREAAAARAAGEASPAADQQPPAAQGEKFKIGKFEVSEGEIETMMQRQAADDLRKATIPPTPDAYQAKTAGRSQAARWRRIQI
jgi:hypothetical protein